MSEREEWINKLLKGCEHDGSYVPVSEVERLMRESRKQGAVKVLEQLINMFKSLRDNSGICEEEFSVYPYDKGTMNELIKMLKKWKLKELKED